VDLTKFPGKFSVKWMHLTEAVIISDKVMDGGKMQTFSNPLTAEAILHLKLIDQSK
jgi:hypothetical protein